jgi:PLD-like domain
LYFHISFLGESIMKLVTRAGAWCNGEVDYIAWDVKEKIENCVGFMVTRIHETGSDAGQRRILPTWVAFTDQNNPNWNEQDSSVWPIQRFEWRDLTLRKSRDTTNVRPIDFKVHYEIVPVGLAAPGQTPIPPSPTAPATDQNGSPSYLGPKHPLVQIGEPSRTNSINVTHSYGDKISATFTNGILSTQNLVRQLSSVNKAPSKAVMAQAASADKKTGAEGAKKKEDHLLKILKQEIVKPNSPIRSFLMADAFEFVGKLIKRAESEGGQVYLALYELHDKELIGLLLDAMKKKLIHIILTTAGNLNPNPKGTAKEKRQPVVWDTENDDPRRRLHAAAGKEKDRVIDRMFDSTARIGHNKFAVYVKGDKPLAVMSGSTNWTETGLCAQSNNCIIVEDDNIAADYFAYWNRLKDDKQAARQALTVTAKAGKEVKGAAPNANKQGQKIRSANQKQPPLRELASGMNGKAWFSPNTKQPAVPKKNPARPVDLKEVYQRMDAAKGAIMFLVFLPGRSGVNNIIGQAADIAGKSDGESTRLAKKFNSIADNGRFVMGAISDPSAMPALKPPAKGTAKQRGGVKLPPPAIWWPGGDQSKVAIIRAAAVRIPFGNLRPELLTAGHAIIHDKIIVIDPLDEKRCTVITGSHNLGYKASYCNDENLLIIEGNRDLAISYAVHVIDLYEHYLMRARLEENIRRDILAGKLKSYEEAAAQVVPHGLLGLGNDWQAKYLSGKAQSSMAYFLANTAPAGDEAREVDHAA